MSKSGAEAIGTVVVASMCVVGTLWLMFVALRHDTKRGDDMHLCKLRGGVYLLHSNECVPPPAPFDAGCHCP